MHSQNKDAVTRSQSLDQLERGVKYLRKHWKEKTQEGFDVIKNRGDQANSRLLSADMGSFTILFNNLGSSPLRLD